MQQLRRDLGLMHAISTVVGIVIGSGIFALPAVVFAQAQAPGLGLLVWFLGGVISLAAGLTVAELTAAMPRAGGTYLYLEAAYGEWMGFLQGWASFLAYNSAMQAALAMMFTAYLTAFVPLSPVMQKVVGLGLLAGLTGINMLGVRFGGWIQSAATIGKLVPIGLLIFVGLPHVNTAQFAPLMPVGKGLGAALAGALLPVLWAYDGWITVGSLAEEIKNPQRNLPLALGLGLLFVAVVYTLFNAVLVGVLPLHTLVGSEKPVMPLTEMLLGSAGSRLIAVGMLVSMFGTLNGVTMAAPRYYLAMARDGLFPMAKQVAKLHPTYQTPVSALLLGGVWSAILLLSGQFGQLLNLVVFVGWLFYVLTMGAVLILRRTRPEMERPYKVWGYPVVPLVGIGAGIWILFSALTTEPKTAALGLGLTLTGLPMYWLLRRKPAAGSAGADEAAAAASAEMAD